MRGIFCERGARVARRARPRGRTASAAVASSTSGIAAGAFADTVVSAGDVVEIFVMDVGGGVGVARGDVATGGAEVAGDGAGEDDGAAGSAGCFALF